MSRVSKSSVDASIDIKVVTLSNNNCFAFSLLLHIFDGDVARVVLTLAASETTAKFPR